MLFDCIASALASLTSRSTSAHHEAFQHFVSNGTPADAFPLSQCAHAEARNKERGEPTRPRWTNRSDARQSDVSRWNASASAPSSSAAVSMAPSASAPMSILQSAQEWRLFETGDSDFPLG